MKTFWKLAAGLSLVMAGTAQAQWKPSKPITIIVPWAAGGAGSIGTKSAMEAAKDGYTWTAGAAKQLSTIFIRAPGSHCGSSTPRERSSTARNDSRNRTPSLSIASAQNSWRCRTDHA